MLSSRSLLWQYVSCIVDGGMSADDIEVHALPLYHCAQLDCFLNVDVFLGATSVIVRAPDPAAMLRAIEAEGATKLFCPPTVWIGLANVRLWNFYGQTEMAPLATILSPEEQLAYAGSAGRAALNVETRVVDDADQRVPAGTVGEIVHRSPHASIGYYRDEDKTRQVFAGGWFHSGDLGVLDEDGRLSIVDRKMDMIKTGGENVASREVEEAIYEQDGVAEVAVFGVSHPTWVEAVTAVVVPKPGATLTSDGVIEHARGRLAGFKVPKYVVVADALPKNPSGKILKRQLRFEHGSVAVEA